MDAQRWLKVKAVFDAALDLPSAERPAYIANACGDDDDLREEVESLITAEEESETFLGGGAAEFLEEAPEDRIGPYHLISRIGAGGMGEVYLAEREDEFRQKVALKLMRRGMDSGLVVARFRYERQILAALSHPNIARLYDGGATKRGQPYFVMEYVEGLAIDQYCESKRLSTAARLRLFRQVCAAVQHAHQSLVVHRDIKPANILVTSDGAPKLLDFGIAKLLRRDSMDESTALTRVGIQPMTPEYASPEQVRGEPVTTATDVYSLGLVLYRLLAGCLPYRPRSRSMAELARSICEDEAPPPSTLIQDAKRRRETAGDVDTIALKAIEKDVSQRYASAEQLSEDIRRHLEGQPISARPHTLAYRAQKFVRRNRVAVIAAALVAFSLAAGLAASLWSAHIAGEERARAERRFNDVRRLANTYLFEFHDLIRDVPGTTEARRVLVTRAVEYLGNLEREAAGDTQLELELAEAWVRLGDVQGNPYRANLGDPPGALKSYDSAVRITEGIARREPGNRAAERLLARACQQRGDVLPVLGREADGLASTRRAAELLAKLVAADPASIEYRVELASSQEALGDVLGHPGTSGLEDPNAAAAAYTESLTQWKEVLARQPGHARATGAVAILSMKLGDLEMTVERLDQARVLYAEALRRLEATGLKAREHVRIAGSVRRKLAYVLSYTDTEKALEEYRKAAVLFDKLTDADPKDSRARMDAAVVNRDMGLLEETLDNGRTAAIASYRRSLAHLATDASDAANFTARYRHAEIEMRLGRLFAEGGRMEEAAKVTSHALKEARDMAERPGATTQQIGFYAEALLNAKPTYLRNADAALRHASRALEETGGSNTHYLELVAEAQFQCGQSKEAVATIEKALALLPAESAGRAELKRQLGKFQKSVIPK